MSISSNTTAGSSWRAPPHRSCRARTALPERGFSLIELMVALFIAGLLLLGLSAYFVSSSRAFSDTERTSRQIENGRYAAALMSEDIRHAGFYGEISNVVNLPATAMPPSVTVPLPIPLPASLPNPCDTAIANVALAMSLPVQGVDNATAGTCLTDYVAGTDVLVVRRSNTATTTAAAANAAGNGYYTQVSFCPTAVPIFMIAQSGFNMTDKDCATAMPVRQYHVYIYYIGSCSIGTGTNGACTGSDPQIPTLKRAELVAGGTTPFPTTPLVEGIENMQIEYGLDTTADGSPDSYTADPGSVANWSKVVAIRLHLLARNTDITPGFTDTKTYQLGLNADGSANNVTPGGGYRRHVYTQLVRVQNVSQRLEPVFGTP